MRDLFQKTNWDGINQPNQILERFPTLAIGFTTRNGGESCAPFDSLNVGLHVSDDKESVIKNRLRVSEMLGFPLSNWVTIEQVHHNHIEKFDKNFLHINRDIHQPLFPSCDGVYTDQKNILLVTFYADCTPLYFFAPKYGFIGLAHSGWKGTATEIGKKMIQIWVEKENIPRSDIHVVIGPSIGACCYEVDDHIRLPILKTIDSALNDQVFVSKGNGKYGMDLKRINYFQMIACGILENQIYCTNHCTSCLNEVYFSYRRDQGKTGRMMSFIGLKEDYRGSFTTACTN